MVASGSVQSRRSRLVRAKKRSTTHRRGWTTKPACPGSPLTVYAGYQARHPYALDRDLILVDQRGMGRSEPRLCPEMQGALVNAMLAVATDPTSEALTADRAAHAACRDLIRSRGIDLDTFGTAATVGDHEWVRRALGIDSWNVVGESYGTTVAMTLLASHPEHVRTAVLDSLNLPDAYLGTPWSARVASAREAFFAAGWAGQSGTAPAPDLGVPTLVLQGQFDPNMRPEQSRRVADVIGSHAHWVEFAGIGHSVRHYSRCAQDLVAAFIAAPDREFAAACATRRPDPDSQAPVQP